MPGSGTWTIVGKIEVEPFQLMAGGDLDSLNGLDDEPIAIG